MGLTVNFPDNVQLTGKLCKFRDFSVQILYEKPEFPRVIEQIPYTGKQGIKSDRSGKYCVLNRETNSAIRE
jgi:hypothetical protein